MKSGICLALFLASVFVTLAQNPPGRLPRIVLYGREYVRLDDWARANGGQVRWMVPKQDLKVTLSGGQLLLTVDSRKASLKGTQIWLSAPVAFKNGLAYLAAVDVVSTLNPVLYPSKNPAGRRAKTIVLDAGHGGRDPGNMEGRRQEKQFTLTFARELSDLLTKSGFNVSLTRQTDTTLDLPERAAIARRRGADLFLSLHFNSADGPGASAVKGSEVYCMTPVRTSSTNARGEGAGAGAYPGNRSDAKNILLAYQIQKAITEKTGAEDRGIKRARFQILRDAEMPAVLIEAGFMTNPSDARRIYEPVPRRQLAQAIVDGVLAYKKLVERP
jgi:N-acetylmuramoyl-L-alanine amidase